jgi:hypothetical protein
MERMEEYIISPGLGNRSGSLGAIAMASLMGRKSASFKKSVELCLP